MSGFCADCATVIRPDECFCSNCGPPTDALHWRAVAVHYQAEGDGWWHGRWRTTRSAALKQAQRWADEDDCADVRVEDSVGGSETVEAAQEPAA